MSITIDGQLYILTFEDEFDQDNTWQGIGDENIWSTSYRPHLDDSRNISANNEHQYYVDNDMLVFDNPLTYDAGTVTINASELDASQQAVADGLPYSSGLMSTEMSFGFTYGYIEMRADIPDEQGFWSSLWLLPTQGEWVSEIDVFEITGGNSDTIHTNYWQNTGAGLEPDQLDISGTQAGDGFHTYGLLWTDTTLQWFYDGVLIREVSHEISDEMYILFSLAIGGFAGDPDATTDFSDGMTVDYLRVYELEISETRNLELTGPLVSQDLHNGINASEYLYGTRFDDIITGGQGGDTVYGRDGMDDLHGNTGFDELYGGVGDDKLFGGAGKDKLVGGAGADRITGGKGNDNLWGGSFGADNALDEFVFKADSGKDLIHDFETEYDLVVLKYYVNGTWADLQNAMNDQGWATQIDLAALGGQTGDQVFLVGIDMMLLTEDNFSFVDIPIA